MEEKQFTCPECRVVMSGDELDVSEGQIPTCPDCGVAMEEVTEEGLEGVEEGEVLELKEGEEEGEEEGKEDDDDDDDDWVLGDEFDDDLEDLGNFEKEGEGEKEEKS